MNPDFESPIYDPVAEEIYEIRRKICEECDYDFKKLGERWTKLQEQRPDLLVRYVPKTEIADTVKE
jgi:hypothetical protein